MRVSISNIAWDNKYDDFVSLLLRKHKINAIDIAPGKYFKDFANTKTEDISNVRNWWADKGVEIIGMQSLLFGRNNFAFAIFVPINGIIIIKENGPIVKYRRNKKNSLKNCFHIIGPVKSLPASFL